MAQSISSAEEETEPELEESEDELPASPVVQVPASSPMTSSLRRVISHVNIRSSPIPSQVDYVSDSCPSADERGPAGSGAGKAAASPSHRGKGPTPSRGSPNSRKRVGKVATTPTRVSARIGSMGPPSTPGSPRTPGAMAVTPPVNRRLQGVGRSASRSPEQRRKRVVSNGTPTLVAKRSKLGESAINDE